MAASDKPFIAEVIKPLGLRSMGRRWYALDMLRDYWLEIGVGPSVDDEPDHETTLTLYCPREELTMRALCEKQPDLTRNMAGFSTDYEYTDKFHDPRLAGQIKVGMVTTVMFRKEFYFVSYHDHMNNDREKRFPAKQYLQDMAAITDMKAFFQEYSFGLAGQVLASMGSVWSSIFLCLEMNMQPSEILDTLTGPEFECISRRWGLKQPLEIKHVKDMRDVYVEYVLPKT